MTSTTKMVSCRRAILPGETSQRLASGRHFGNALAEDLQLKDSGTDIAEDLLFDWIKDDAVKSAILLDEEADPAIVADVNRGYAPDLTDGEVEQLGRDPCLIAYALAAPADRCVVTTEASKSSKTRQNRRVPDVCNTMGVSCCDTFAMLRALRFTTG